MNLVRSARPERQLLTLFFVVGGSLAAFSDLFFLTLTRYWEKGGWSADRPRTWSPSGAPSRQRTA